MDPTAEFTLLTDHDIYLWNEGSHFRLYEKMGSHLAPDGEGTYFAVWAPNAEGVSVIGDWNGWDPDADPLRPVGSSGVWAAFVPAARAAHAYKYRIRNGSYQVDKADPFAFHHETPPRTASKIWDLTTQQTKIVRSPGPSHRPEPCPALKLSRAGRWATGFHNCEVCRPPSRPHGASSKSRQVILIS